MTPAFEIFRDDEGQYRFRLRAGNGEIVAASEGYTTKQSCQEGVAVIVKVAALADLKDLTTDV